MHENDAMSHQFLENVELLILPPLSRYPTIFKVGEKKTKVLTTAFIEIEDWPFPMTPAKRYRLARRGIPFSGLNLPFSSVYAPIPVVYTIILLTTFCCQNFLSTTTVIVLGDGQVETEI